MAFQELHSDEASAVALGFVLDGRQYEEKIRPVVEPRGEPVPRRVVRLRRRLGRSP
ncbi:MAG: hypothetical protein U0835_26595 [Isosphaeraceae bacterium]